MNKETLGSWGKKIREVELETKNGRVTICKAFGIHELSLTTIQVPTKIKATLHIEDGAYVKVRPLTS